MGSAARRPQFLLEHQLDDVSERLQQPFRADEIRAQALLQERGNFSLEVHHPGRRAEQRDEDEERQDDLGGQQRCHKACATKARRVRGGI